MKSREKVNAFSQIPENNEVSWSFIRETPLKRHLTPGLALISENTPWNAFLFLRGQCGGAKILTQFRNPNKSCRERNLKKINPGDTWTIHQI